MRKIFMAIFLLGMTMCLYAFAGVPTSVTINNVAPTVDSIAVNDGSDVTVPPEGSVDVEVRTEVSDDNGYEDIDTVKALVTGPGSFSQQIVLAKVTNVDTTTDIYNGTLTIDYQDLSGSYSAAITVNDSANAEDSDSQGFTVVATTGISIDATSITFPAAAPGGTGEILGDTSMGTLTAPTVKNIGNTLIDVTILGTDLIGPETIAVGSIDYSFDALSMKPLQTTAQTEDLNLVPGQTESLNLNLTVPIGTLAGSYSGDITIGTG